MALKLNIVVCSTRPGRAGIKIAKWFDGFARDHGLFDIEFVDLAELNLPIFDEPKHPRFGDYQHDHTRRWSSLTAAADAFVFVSPEYNHFAPPTMVNALTYLVKEWAYKPAAILSYGGISGGLRAAVSEKLLLTTLKMVPITESVPVPMFAQMIGEDGVFRPTEPVAAGSKVMLDELHRWAEALKPMRG